MSKALRILLICLLAISAVTLVAFYIQNSTGIFVISNLAEAMASQNMVDVLMYVSYVMLFAAILLVVILTIMQMADNRKTLKRTGIILLLAVVLIGVSFLLASGDPVPVSIDAEPTYAQFKLTDTVLIMSYILVVVAFVALIWGGFRKLIQNR